MLYFPIENPASYSSKMFYICLEIRSKLSIVVPCTTRQVPCGGIFSSSISQTKIFETVDVAMENHKNLSMIYRRTADRTCRIVRGTLGAGS